MHGKSPIIYSNWIQDSLGNESVHATMLGFGKDQKLFHRKLWLSPRLVFKLFQFAFSPNVFLLLLFASPCASSLWEVYYSMIYFEAKKAREEVWHEVFIFLFGRKKVFSPHFLFYSTRARLLQKPKNLSFLLFLHKNENKILLYRTFSFCRSENWLCT